MAQSSFGEWLQKLLFTTSFKDIIESIDGLKTRIEELDSKLEREVGVLQRQLDESRAQAGKPPPAQNSGDKGKTPPSASPKK